jgi:ParB family transcriptional regulator, chromosome partitioning protein
MQRMTVSLDQLIINPAINPRHVSDVDVKDLVAQISTNGFTDALWVRKVADGFSFEIIDGSRRFAALKQLNWADPIPVDVIDADDARARELALGANVARRDLSPADEAEAFTALYKGRLDAGEIAARFATTKKLVRQRIAIGSLPAVIIDALRQGVIDVDVAEAFTVNPSSERQLEVFGEGRNLTEWSVRRQLTEDAIADTDHRFNFVGHDAYVAAGGTINEDLFGNTSFITDAALLQRLFDEKVATTTQGLKDKGWKWVKLLDRLAVRNHKFERQNPKGKAEQTEEQKQSLATQVEHLKALQAEYDALENIDSDTDEWTDEKQERYGEMEDLIGDTEVSINALKLKPYTQKQMASLGVLLLCRDHAVEFVYGMLDPKDVKAVAKDKTPDPDEAADDSEEQPPAPVKAETAGYSDAIERQLLGVARDCTRLALTQKPAMAYRLGLAARVCAFLNDTDVAQSDYNSEDLYPPFVICRHHVEDEGKLHDAQALTATIFEGCTTYMDVAARLETLTPETILQIEAVLAASLLQVTALKNTDAQALINHADPDMRATGFAPSAEFFKGISRDQLLLISAEIDCNNIIKKGKKPDMVEALLPQVEASGWLPPQLRTPSYEGPGSEAYTPHPEVQGEALPRRTPPSQTKPSPKVRPRDELFPHHPLRQCRG